MEWDAFDKANATIHLIKNERVIQKRHLDLCKKHENNIHTILTGFGLSEVCPSPRVSNKL